jgi:hypothetical protein
MTKRYGDPILVAESTISQPRCFIWRGTMYRVQEVLAIWHLQDRWWDAKLREQHTGVQTAGESDRQYYRLDCSPELLCEIYFDSVSDSWILDRVYD